MTSSNAPLLEQAAYIDAVRILQDTEPLPPVEPPPALRPPTPPRTTASTTASIDLDSIGEAEARKIVSEEHRALGFRPPDGSLAAQAQAAAARHPEGSLIPPNEKALAEAAEADAVRVAGEMGGQPSYKMQHISVPDEASLVMSEEHSELGYRPPAGSLAAEAQSAAARHPEGEPGVEHPDPISLVEAAREDAERVAAEREPDTVPSINLHTITRLEAQQLESLEHKSLGYTPPSGSLAAQAQAAVARRGAQPVTKGSCSSSRHTELAAFLYSEEHRTLGYEPPPDNIAVVAQSLADQNAMDGGTRTLADAGV
ncbi:hypothetical protein BN946_scf184999.g61 [Trametes cinnabarina]|uniref:SMP domain-containing protein n=1 Tax=Pycnoporus cinnabarinus TaxID=5643 RepID=A0A060S7T4_PYCCI|nr:hypothetical protein BN946_scf184999.g61 [Trametes cinnabarina]